MGCGSSSGQFFETTTVLKLPTSLVSAEDTEAYDYILSTFMSPAVIMQLPNTSAKRLDERKVTTAFEVQGGVIVHVLEERFRRSGGHYEEPQSDFYETKQRTHQRMQIELFTAKGTISDPASVKEQAFCVTTVDIALKRTSQGVETTFSGGQPAFSEGVIMCGGVGVRMGRPLFRRTWERELAAREELYASGRVRLPASAGGAKTGQEFKVVISKTIGQKLGLSQSSEDGATLKIGAVSSGGLVQQWNESHPELAVQPGDFIVEVNGVRDDAQQMLQECKHDKTLELVVRHGQAQSYGGEVCYGL